ncbi:PREDICTED: probable chitinase 3 [Rhagoletis zephyria]|uniref:probable chitinase 3 n=1 Tax=Rhagoletis zephyria TaxID=28612 RepID=UPI0008114D2A|nr:PREDICTED: probable chitinase 3 [Rhagoletis zephyria]
MLTLSRFSMRPSFGDVFLPLRSAVESVPSVDLHKLSELTDSLGVRSFIRDSVEALPADGDDDEDEDEDTELVANAELIRSTAATHTEGASAYERETDVEAFAAPDPWTVSDKYAAFAAPSLDKKYLPQPYRADSPYQQLLNPKEVEHFDQLDDVELLREQFGYGALTHSQNGDIGEYYGAPTHLKSAPPARKNYNNSPKVLCHITNWAFYRKADGKFVPENLDTSLCTTIIYSFASLDPDHLTIKEFDPWVDVENQYYNRAVESGVPVMIALGGWTDSTGDKYSRLAGNEIKRKVFSSNLVGFLKRNGFAGLHLDWNYPKCWQSDCSKGPSSDKPNLTKLLREIRNEFDRVDKKLQLGVALSGYKEIITEAYELAEISKIVDYMTVMTYDYHGAWEGRTGHVSPLYGRKGDRYPQYNTDYAMQLLVKSGAKREKLIMGIPFYGQSFTLERASTSLVGEGVATSAPGEPGEFTKQPGMLAYYEICHRIRKDKWLTGRDVERKSGPYAMLRNQWVGYEDPASVEAKARYAANNDFGGVAAWTVDLDDFQNRCCSESFPLLKAINRALGLLNSEPPTRGNCARPSAPVTPVPPVMTTVSSDGSPGSTISPQHDHITSTTPITWWPTSSSTSTTPWWTPTSTTPAPTTTRRTTTTTRRTTTTTRATTTTSTTTTRRPTVQSTTSRRPHRPEHTTIPSPAVVRPVVQASNCQPGQFYADRYNCNAYYQCIQPGELHQQFCPGGLHWNDQNKSCDWPASAKCSERNKPVATAHSATTRPTKLPGTTARAPTKRTTTSYGTTRVPNRTTRPATTVAPTALATTSRKPTKKPSSKPSRKPTPQKPQRPSKPQRPNSKCNNGEYYTHKKCDQYYICINGALVPNSCGGDLHWDAIRQTCDWPENVQCITTKQYFRIVKSQALRSGNPVALRNSNPSDPCDGEERVAYPGDCSKYLFCLWNRLQGSDCPPGLHFNEAIRNCDWPQSAQCTQDEGGQGAGEIESLEPGVNEISQGGPVVVKPKPTKRPAPTTTTTTTRVPRPTYPTDKPILAPLDGYYKVVCYFTNWAWYRKGVGRYTPDDINTDLCTHIVYGFAVLDYSNLVLRTHDSWADIDNNFYTRVSGLRSKGVKVSLALGGWNDSQGDKYSRLVRNPTARARFVKHAIDFLEKYGFEGLDLDWEYPVCWQTDCKKGVSDEKEAFTALVRELSEEFKPRGLLLSTAVSPSKKIIDAGYDVPQLAEYFDWIAVMTYDFHGQWDKKTGHVAPLFYHPEDEIDYFNANFSLNYWIEKGAPSRKIVMGMPLYGQSFTLENVKTNGLNAKAPGPGKAGEFTRAAGFLAYYEICDRIKNDGWEVIQDEQGRMGPYARKGTQWVSFDDPPMIRKKSQLIRALDLGGGMVWALDLDDFRNRCGDGVHPLLTQIHDVLKDPPKEYEEMPGVTANDPVAPNTETESGEDLNTIEGSVAPEEIETGLAEENVIDPNGDVEEVSASAELGEQAGTGTGTIIGTATGTGTVVESGTQPSDFKVVCYFTNWAWYRQNGGKFLPEDIDPDLCTHIVYGFAVLNRESLTIQPHDSWADLDNKFYERVVAFRKKGIKVTVAIGGWNDSAGDKYSRLVRNAAARARFINHIIDFIQKYGFDGLDLDWEYPVCWQVDCKKGTSDEKDAFTALVRELSQAFKPQGLLLSSAVSPNKKVIDAGYDVPSLSRYFDWIAVMTYDFHGQWDKKTGHVAPMYDHPAGTETFNANFSINYWLQSGADRQKIIMGMPMYGQSFSLAQASDHDLNAPTYGGGEAGEATRARGFLAYYEICSYIRKRGWSVVRDPRGRMGPYAFQRDQWVSFDDVSMIRHKSEFVRAMGLGGAMIWALDLDDFKNVCGCESYPLLKTINRVLRNYPGPAPKCVLELKDNTMIASDKGPSQAYSAKPKPVETTRPTYSSQPIETTEPLAIAALEDFGEEETKPCNGRNFAPHERDCNKYYICQFEKLIEQRCPAGLHWNEFYCDWPLNSKCFMRQEATTGRPRPTAATTKRPQPTKATSRPKPVASTSAPRPTKPTKKPSKLPDKKPTARPKPPTLPPINRSGDYKVVCYFTNWAWYRPSDGKYLPEDIDENLCTHIVYGFAVLNSETLTIRTHDSWADIDNHFYERVVAYKSKGIRVTIAIGGWNDSLGSKYARLVLDSGARARFIQSILTFIDKYGFEGLDLDWEYPVCWQVDCTKGAPAEKEAFAALVRELSAAFKPRDLLLSAAVSPSKTVIDAGYDVSQLARYFDWIAVMTYDFHGNWDKQTGHVAPLYYVDGDTNEYFNANFSINYWLEKGTPREKLIMGMPLYGQSFTLADVQQRGLNTKSTGPGQAGAFTRAAGFLAYYEICEKVNNGGWSVIRDAQGRIGPYAYNGNQWVSYDDVSDIRRKAQFVKSLGLGGGMVWALDLDDFRGRCGCGKHPLLRTLTQELRGIPGQRAHDCT